MLLFRLFCILFFIATFSFGQQDSTTIVSPDNSFVPLNLPSNNNSNDFNLPSFQNPNNNKLRGIEKRELKTPEREMTMKKEEFDNLNDVFKKKLNKKIKPKQPEGGNSFAKKFQFLGEFKLKSKIVRLAFRDFADPDGDRVKIKINGETVHNNILLLSSYQIFTSYLHKGFNKIEFIALSQGMYGPNTAEISAFDENGNILFTDQWNLVTGGTASVLLIKE